MQLVPCVQYVKCVNLPLFNLSSITPVAVACTVYCCTIEVFRVLPRATACYCVYNEQVTTLGLQLDASNIILDFVLNRDLLKIQRLYRPVGIVP